MFGASLFSGITSVASLLISLVSVLVVVVDDFMLSSPRVCSSLEFVDILSFVLVNFCVLDSDGLMLLIGSMVSA